MDSFAPLPIGRRLLERYRLDAGRRVRANPVGGHLLRRKGQSLEFRDFAPYVPGDDVRHIDWRASERTGDELLVRTFIAEEHLKLVISIDNRDTMRLPEAMPKLQVALWLAEALATVAIAGHDRAVLHRLFEGPGAGLVELPHTRPGAALSRARRLMAAPAAGRPNLRELRPELPPTAVWVIVSDLYFDLEESGKRLAREIAAAQDGYRWVLLVDLDSWAYESRPLRAGAWRIDGPGAPHPDEEVEIDEARLAAVAAAIESHKRAFRKLARLAPVDVTSWEWPPTGEPAGAEARGAFWARFFEQSFVADRTLRRLFERDA